MRHRERQLDLPAPPRTTAQTHEIAGRARRRRVRPEGTPRASSAAVRTMPSLSLAGSLLLAVTALGTGDAAADVDRCAGADTDLAWRGTDLAEIAGDTGWFPSGFVAQLRLTGRVVGHTAVEAGVRTTACWEDGMQAQVAGRAGSGWLDVAYGAELQLRGRIHTTVLGRTINWEGDIPIPYIPMDLVLEGQTAFDPAVDATELARVSDSASPITLLSTNALDGIIDIVGISGGLRITAQPIMATTYRTRTATLAGETVAASTDRVGITPGEGGFGGALDLAVAADGVIRYEPTLRFNASFDVTILGIRVVNWDIASVSMNLPALERPIRLAGDDAHLALPVLDGLGDGARMDFATGTTQELRVRNTGEGPLALEAIAAPAGALVSTLDVPAGGEAMLRVFVGDDAAFANGPLTLTVATNDPDHPRLAIQLGKQVGGTDPGDVEEPALSGGCTATGGAPGSATLLALGVLGLVVRRRRRVA